MNGKWIVKKIGDRPLMKCPWAICQKIDKWHRGKYEAFFVSRARAREYCRMMNDNISKAGAEIIKSASSAFDKFNEERIELFRKKHQGGLQPYQHDRLLFLNKEVCRLAPSIAPEEWAIVAKSKADLKDMQKRGEARRKRMGLKVKK